METKLGEKAWYAINTFPGQENRVAESLEGRVDAYDMTELIFRIIVAEHDVEKEKVTVRKGTEIITVKENLYPGYVFIEMIMTDEAWYMVRNTQGVTGFVGSSGKGTKPFPIPADQIEAVLKRMNIVDSEMYDRYHIGDIVKITNGPFADTTGTILEIDKETGKVKVEIIFFGRVTPMEFDFSEIEKSK